eukprot:gene3753-4103_t
MRGAHEAFKAAIKEMIELLEQPEHDLNSFQTLWRDFHRAATVHFDMEEIDFFPLIASLSTAVEGLSKAGEFHVTDLEFSSEVDELLSAADPIDWDALKHAFHIWKEFHLYHLLKEEEELFPVFQQGITSAESRCSTVQEKLIVPTENRNFIEYKFFIGYCLSQLVKYGSSDQTPNEAVTSYLRGLRSTALKIEWQAIVPVCRDNCPAELWQELIEKYSIESEDDIHLIPLMLTRAISEVNLEDLPRVLTPLWSPSPVHQRSKGRFREFPTKELFKEEAPQVEYYDCKCHVM